MIYRFKKTFIGVGGREYISNPKLSFPEHVKIRRRGTNPRSGQPYTEAGSAFVETSAVAARLCCSASAARQYLHRHGVRFRVVRKGTGPLALYWRRLDVERVLAGREPVRRRGASVLYGYGRGCQHAGSSAQLCLQAGEKRAAA